MNIPTWVILKKRVLDFAVEEINEHTDFSVRYEQIKQGKTITGFLFKFKLKPKQAQIASETLKTTSDSLNTIKPLTEPQIAKYSMILCKLGSISDLAGTMDYPTFANWLGNILRDPKNSNQETVKRVFKTLRTETDYNSKHDSLVMTKFPKGALTHFFMKWKTVRFSIENKKTKRKVFLCLFTFSLWQQ